MTGQAGIWNVSEGPSYSQKSPVTEEDIDEQEVAEALFDLANMFHRQPPKVDPGNHGQGVSRAEDAVVKDRLSPERPLEAPGKNAHFHTSVKRVANREPIKPRTKAVLSSTLERLSSLGSREDVEKAGTKDVPSERASKAKLEAGSDKIARSRDTGLELKTCDYSVEFSKEDRYQHSSKDGRLLELERERPSRNDGRIKDQPKTMVSLRGLVKQEIKDVPLTTSELQDGGSHPCAGNKSLDTDAQVGKDEGLRLHSKLRSESAPSPTSAPPVSPLPPSMIGNWMGVAGAVPTLFSMPTAAQRWTDSSGLGNSSFVSPQALTTRKEQEPGNSSVPAKSTVLPSKPKFKRCACHVYIAHMIAQQQLQQSHANQNIVHMPKPLVPPSSVAQSIDAAGKLAGDGSPIVASGRIPQPGSTARPIPMIAKERHDSDGKCSMPVPQLPPAFSFLPPTLVVSGPMAQPSVSLPRSSGVCPPAALSTGALPMHPHLVPLHGNAFHFPFQLPLNNAGNFPPGLAHGHAVPFLGAHQFPFAGVFPSQLQATGQAAAVRPELLLQPRGSDGKDMERSKYDANTQEELMMKYAIQAGFLDSRPVPLLSAARIGFLPPEALGPDGDSKRHPLIR